MGWKHVIASAVFSSELIEALRKEKRLLGWRLLCFSPLNLGRIRRLRHARNLRLNLGAGKHRKDGWTNIDLISAEGGLRWDLRWRFPLAPCSADRIHCEHFLEHLEYPGEALPFLLQCYRVLTPGGRIRVIVPDVGLYAHAYAKNDQDFWKRLRNLGNPSRPFDTKVEILNQTFRMGGAHRFAYDRDTLERLLVRAGFEILPESEQDESQFIDQEDEWRRWESLYVAASKPTSAQLQAERTLR